MHADIFDIRDSHKLFS